MGFPIFVFDAYGTLFDVHSAVARHRERIGPQADRLSELWRTKQLEYTWTRSLMGGHRDFDLLTGDALDFAAARCGGISPAAREALLAAYETLDAYPTPLPRSRPCRRRAPKCVISRPERRTLERAVGSAGLQQWLDVSLSVDPLRIFKTSPAAYQMVCDRYGVRPDQVSSSLPTAGTSRARQNSAFTRNGSTGPARPTNIRTCRRAAS